MRLDKFRPWNRAADLDTSDVLNLKVALNPLRDRADLQRALGDLWLSARPYLVSGGATASLGDIPGIYGARISSLETIARPLWGLAADADNNGFADWDLYREMISKGVDPAQAAYWGAVETNDQRAVEMAAIAYGLLLAPEKLWTPLTARARRNLVRWLSQINQVSLYKTNWLWFRLIVNAALVGVGEEPDLDSCDADRKEIDAFYKGEGWFSDGRNDQSDYYVPMAMHFYGLLLAKLDPSLSAQVRATAIERARLFAQQYTSWFSMEGAAIPYGRSLTYRFAQGAFWGALAFANVEARPWGEIKGYYLRHLRWWFRQPIFSDAGLLTVGYIYPNNIVAEAYNSPASPYWAFKSFLPLALPAEHPFWQAEEIVPIIKDDITAQCGGAFVLCRDGARDHVFMLASQSTPYARHRHSVQKYSKFVYSAAFGFGVPVGGTSPQAGGGDCALLVSKDQRDWHARETFTLSALDGHTQYTSWSPFPHVQIDSWIAPALPGHVRAHRIKTTVGLHLFEGGFSICRDESFGSTSISTGALRAESNQGCSSIRDLAQGRQATLISTEPGTNLIHPLTRLPGLVATIEPGETWLFTAVAGLPGKNQAEAEARWAAQIEALPVAQPPMIIQAGKPILVCRIPGQTEALSNDGHILRIIEPRSPVTRVIKKSLAQAARKLGLKR